MKIVSYYYKKIKSHYPIKRYDIIQIDYRIDGTRCYKIPFSERKIGESEGVGG